MSDKKSPPSFIKSISDTILLSTNLSFSDTSQIHPYEKIGQKELGQQPTRNNTSLIQIGGSLTIFASVLIIVLTTWLANEKISYTKVYRDTIVTEFDGWGTSLAWWAEFIGSLDEKRRKEFISRVFHPSNEDSLQFNIIRFNMGGAPEILPNGTTADVDFSPFKGIPSLELSNRTYDWNADTFQLSVVQDILLLNNSSMIIEAFSNSPPWWMTKSKNSMGNFDGSDNLDLVNYVRLLILS